ncbi:MAG: TraR/DksA family transcriptional regulator [Cellulomonas sp.]
MTGAPAPRQTPGGAAAGLRAPDLRAQLLGERAAAVTAVAAAEGDFQRLVEAARSVATDDEHDPEGPGLAVERALVDAFRVQARARLADVDRALERLDAGSYGRCETCGGAIAADRLAARPGARTCIDCARAASRRG